MVNKKRAKAKRPRIKSILLLISGFLIVASIMTYIIANEAYYNSDKQKWFTIYKDMKSTESLLGETDDWAAETICTFPRSPFMSDPPRCRTEIHNGYIKRDAAEVKAEVDAFYKQLDKTGLWEARGDGKDDYPSINEHPANEFDTRKSGSRTYRNKATGHDCHAFSELQENNYNYLNLTFNCSGEALKSWYDIQYQRSLKKFLEE